MYFDEKNIYDNAVKAMIIKKIHFVNEFKINILIDNHILNLELFDISMFISIAYIENCKIIIFITIVFYKSE